MAFLRMPSTVVCSFPELMRDIKELMEQKNCLAQVLNLKGDRHDLPRDKMGEVVLETSQQLPETSYALAYHLPQLSKFNCLVLQKNCFIKMEPQENSAGHVGDKMVRP